MRDSGGRQWVRRASQWMRRASQWMRLASQAALYTSVAAAAGVAWTSARALPYVPERDDVVLEKSVLPVGAERELRALQAAVRADPANLDLALRAAERFLQRGRESGDPRFAGYAEAALAPWWHEREPPVPVLVLRATVRQSQHAFEPALADLAQVLARDPDNLQAWLTRSTVELVAGRPDAARASCAPLRRLGPALIAVTCEAAADSQLGRASEAYAALDAALAATPGARGTVGAWSRTLLAEIATQLGRDHDAERHFRAVLAAHPDDPYAQGVFADFLLAHGRAPEVLRLVPPDTRSDPLFLRAVLAARASGDPRAAAWTAALADRLAASRARGDTVHLREDARFALALGDAREALQLALANWRAQKELRDAELVLASALAAGQPGAARDVLEHLTRFRIDSVELRPLVDRLEPRR